MSCCGGRRKAYKEYLTSPPLLLRRINGDAKYAIGPVTGKVYEFAPGVSETEVDGRDAVELLKMEGFGLAPPKPVFW
jgi:hypothetical protein